MRKTLTSVQCKPKEIARGDSKQVKVYLYSPDEKHAGMTCPPARLPSCYPIHAISSGVTTEEKLLSKENEINPDFYVNSIVDFFE